MSVLYAAVCGASDPGIVRSNNEDAFAVLDLSTDELVDVSAGHTMLEVGPRGILLVVSDGMGGEKAGEVASALVIESLREHLTGRGDEGDPAEALRLAVEHANARVFAEAKGHAKQGMGATVVAVLIQGQYAYTAEVGDSRAYVARRNELAQITKDQTYMQMLIDRGAIAIESAKTSQAKNVILQAVGKAQRLLVAQRRLALRGGDRIVLCSDGLFGQVRDDEIHDALASTEFLDEACDDLVALANERGGIDNVTVVIASIAGDLPPARYGEDVADTLETLRAYALEPAAPSEEADYDDD